MRHVLTAKKDFKTGPMTTVLFITVGKKRTSRRKRKNKKQRKRRKRKQRKGKKPGKWIIRDPAKTFSQGWKK